MKKDLERVNEDDVVSERYSSVARQSLSLVSALNVASGIS